MTAREAEAARAMPATPRARLRARVTAIAYHAGTATCWR